MIRLYLFNEGGRASRYGIGTYIREMIENLKHYKDISLNIVQMHSEKEEFTIELMDGYIVYHLPNNKNHAYIEQKYMNRYYRNIWFILKKYIDCCKDGDKIVFHLNYIQECCLLQYMKSDYPDSLTIFTVHYQDWSLLLEGDHSCYKKIISADKQKLINKEDIIIYELFDNEKRMYNEVDKIICLSDYTKNMLNRNYKVSENKLITICNGLGDNGVLLNYEDKCKTKRELGFSSKSKILLFVGRLEDGKGVDFLIKIYRQILVYKQNYHLVIVGDGDFSKHMKEVKGYCGKVTFAGSLNIEDVYRFYQIADIGIMLSMYEQCSYVLIEMMMFGIPIIANNVPGVNEMIDDGVNGWKLPICKRDCNLPFYEVTNKMIGFIEMSRRWNKKKSRKVFQHKYTAQKMIEKYLLLLSSFDS